MNVIDINSNEFNEKVLNKEGKVLVDCYALWCGPCKMLSPVVDSVAQKIDNCIFYKLNVDENEDITVKYNILSIPTLLLFENGVLVKQETGFKSESELIDFIK